MEKMKKLDEINIKEIAGGFAKENFTLFTVKKEAEIYSKVRRILNIKQPYHIDGLVHEVGLWMKELKKKGKELDNVIWAISENNKNVRIADNLIKVFLMNNYNLSLEEAEVWLIDNYNKIIQYLNYEQIWEGM